MYDNPLLKLVGLEKPQPDDDAEKTLARQTKPQKETKPKQGRVLQLPETEPADEIQVGVTLLNEVANQVRRFVVADDSDITAITLWIAFSYFAIDAPCCPNLVFSSAVKACGKSTALDVVRRLVPKALTTSNITAAALFRAVEMASPTLLIDEADSMFGYREDLRTLVNAGFTPSAATVYRIVGDDNELRMFSVYCPKAIALIGTLPDTIESRSVIIRMRRRLPGEPVDRLRCDVDQGFLPLARRIARWVLDNKYTILTDEPIVPAELSDRQSDAWRELLRIADVAGGEWPVKARSAALELCKKSTDDGDIAIRLLSDIKAVFEANNDREKWPSDALTSALNALDESPWSELNHGRGLTKFKLGKMLGRFGIESKNLRTDTKVLKGYYTGSFSEVFARYLPQNRYSLQN